MSKGFPFSDPSNYYSSAISHVDDRHHTPALQAKDVYNGFVKRAHIVSSQQPSIYKEYKSPFMHSVNTPKQNAFPFISNDMKQNIGQELDSVYDTLGNHIIPTIGVALNTVNILKEAGEKIRHEYTQAYNNKQNTFYHDNSSDKVPDDSHRQRNQSQPSQPTSISTLDDDIVSSRWNGADHDDNDDDYYSNRRHNDKIVQQAYEMFILPSTEALSTIMSDLSHGLEYCSTTAQGLADFTQHANRSLKGSTSQTQISPYDSNHNDQQEDELFYQQQYEQQQGQDAHYQGYRDDYQHYHNYPDNNQPDSREYNDISNRKPRPPRNNSLFSAIEDPLSTTTTTTTTTTSQEPGESSHQTSHFEKSNRSSFWPSWVNLPEPVKPENRVDKPAECQFCLWVRSIPSQLQAMWSSLNH